MKVLLIVHQFFPEHRTGTEVLTLELAHGLRRKGHDVQILTGAPGTVERSSTAAELTEAAYEGITVHRVHYSLATGPDAISLHSSAPDRVELVKRVVLRTAPDIVHVNHFLGLSSAIIPAIRTLQVPVVYTATDYWTICPQITLLHSFDGSLCEGPGRGVDCIRCCVAPFARRSARSASLARSLAMVRVFPANETIRQIRSVTERGQAVIDHVNTASLIISSTRFLADMLARNGVDAGLMRVIPYGVDIGTVAGRRPIPLRFTAADPLRLAFMGTLAEHKGAHIVLDALAALGDRARDISLQLYGKGQSGDPYFEELCSKVDRLGGRAVLAGTFPHDTIGDIISDHHLLVLPSLWYESTPLVLCSALAAGVPALVSRLGGMTEIIEEGITGMSFPPGDTTALKEVLERLLDAPEILAALHTTTKPRRRLTADYVNDVESAYFEVR